MATVRQSNLRDGDIVRRPDGRYYAVFLFDADDCENIAVTMGSDGWAADLRTAAEKVRNYEAPIETCGAPITAGPGAGIPTTCKRERPCPVHDNPALNEVRA